MRRLTHLVLSPPSRFARLLVAEKRLAYDPAAPEDSLVHLPVFTELDGSRYEGMWAIVDHLEGSYEDHPMTPTDDAARAETLRLLDWAMGPLFESVTRKIVFEKGAQRFTGTVTRSAPDMNVIRTGREALKPILTMLGALAEQRGYLAGRDCTLADLAVAAHLSALDYFGEVNWADYPPTAEWYMRMKSRPAFRSLLADKVPGQPPVTHYAELDF
jgi:glutathione S-transferase